MNEYEEAEGFGRDGQEEHGRPTLAQWARGQALQALAASGHPLAPSDDLSDQVHALARLILGV